jgi:sigma-B regulation protein RsbU (phosphoserine phosphatase)
MLPRMRAMPIRRKLLILLLVIALVPTITAAVLHRVWTRRLGGTLCAGTREALEENARYHLQVLVDDYRRLLNRDQRILELAVTQQAQEAERRLAAEPPQDAALFLSQDYDAGPRTPPGLQPSKKHFRADADGDLQPIPVSYEAQVTVLAPGVERQSVAPDLARLSTMVGAYRRLYEGSPEFMYWQYTALESGFHTCYPGHGGYPADYDPRTRPWYQLAKEQGELTWLPPLIEVSTRTVTLGLAVPVHRPDGSFAGVTAIDVALSGVFEDLQLPEPWAEVASAVLAYPGDAETGTEGKLVILAEKGRQERREDWQGAVEWRFLDADEPEKLEALRQDALSGHSGVRRIRHHGRDVFWAYGAAGPEQPFPVVRVPYSAVVARATAADERVMGSLIRGLTITGIILLVVIAAVVLVAYRTSRAVTRPITKLTAAAENLARGDYESPVDIRTGDEFQVLADTFNHMAPRLRERERMQQSLALAMEVQQNLLPQEPPRLEGFEIAGKSDYCEETGGDYYDFIDLVDIGPGTLGIAVGDVSGHGVGAALLMASARAVLRSHAVHHGQDLGRLFTELNRHLVADTADEQFITLFYGVLDAKSRTLSWTSGGHDPALWLRRESGAIEELPNTGIPVGVLDAARYEQAGPITLTAGDIILVGTDGIWEATSPEGVAFGKDRLRKLLAGVADMSAAELRATITCAVHDFRGASPQEDDITLVVIKAV